MYIYLHQFPNHWTFWIYKESFRQVCWCCCCDCDCDFATCCQSLFLFVKLILPFQGYCMCCCVYFLFKKAVFETFICFACKVHAFLTSIKSVCNPLMTWFLLQLIVEQRASYCVYVCVCVRLSCFKSLFWRTVNV